MSNPAAFFVLASLLIPKGDDDSSIMKSLPLGIGKTIHELLVITRVYEILSNELSAFADFNLEFDNMTTDYGIDITKVYIPFGTFPGTNIDSGFLTNILSKLNNVYKISTRQLTTALDQEVWYTDVIMSFYDGVSGTMKKGDQFSPHRYLTIRDVYTLIVLKRVVNILRNLSIFTPALLNILVSKLFKGFLSDNKISQILNTVTGNSSKLDTLTDRLGDPAPDSIASLLSVSEEDLVLLYKLKLFLL